MILMPIEKFIYLLACLSDKALNIINGLPVTTLNYPIAYDILLGRYQNPRHLVILHINKSIDMLSTTHNSFKSIQQFLDVYSEHS